jgi:tetratricopeptide (TPR) repeat protein
MLVPEGAREPVLMAAHHAYTVWSQQFVTGALVEESQTGEWKSFLGMDVRMGEAYRQMGATAYQEGRYEEATKLLSIAVDFLDADASLLGELGYSQKSIGQYERAIESLTRATALDGARPDLWIWLGDSQRLMGEYEEAYRSFVTARDVAPKDNASEVDNFIVYTQSLNDLTPSWENFELHRDFAKRHEETGRVLRLIAEYHQALRVAPEVAEDDTENLYKLAWVQMQIGSQYDYIKNSALAVDYFLQAIDTYTRSKSDADLMRVHQNTALSYEKLADRYPKVRQAMLEKAASHWESSLNMARSAGEPSYVRHTQGGLLATLASLRPLDDPRIVELRAALEKEIPWRGPINDFTVASAARGETECRLREGDLAGARLLIELSDSYYQGTGFLVDLEYRASAQEQLARIYLSQDHLQKAREVANGSIQQVLSLRKFLDADAYLRSMNPQTMRRAATISTLTAIEEGSPEFAFEAAERYQLQLAQDLLGSRVKDDAWRNDFHTEDMLLLDREAWFKTELDKATAARDTARMDWLQSRMDDLHARVKRIVPASALPDSSKISYSPLNMSTPLETQEMLPEATAILHLLVGQAGGAAVIMSNAETKAFALPEANEQRVEDALLVLRGANGNAASDAGKEALASLKQALLEPIRAALPASGTLVLVGDLLTSFLPLRALDAANELIPANVRVCSAPSATAYLQIARARRDAKAVSLDAATGADLAASFTTATPGNAVLINANVDLGTEDPTLALWTTEGAAPDALPMLTASLLGMKLPHALMALSLELSAANPLLMQNHVSALAECAWRSGATAIVLNQWPVAAGIREEFYKALSDNLASQEPIEAYQMAQDILRTAHPDSLDWAAFTYLGAP